MTLSLTLSLISFVWNKYKGVRELPEEVIQPVTVDVLKGEGLDPLYGVFARHSTETHVGGSAVSYVGVAHTRKRGTPYFELVTLLSTLLWRKSRKDERNMSKPHV